MTAAGGLPPSRDFPQPVECWCCGSAMDAYTHAGPEDVGPDDGSPCVCIECGALALFVSSSFGLTLRPPTDDELAALLRDPDITRILLARQEALDGPFDRGQP